MKPFIWLALASSSLSLAQFVDVPPCHWAAGAVAAISNPAPVQASALGNPQLVANSLEQVFEGLKCGDAEYSKGFLQGFPAGFAPGKIDGFSLSTSAVKFSGQNATLNFVLSLNSNGSTRRHSGQARLQLVGKRWLVEYAGLKALGVLP
jgi:hypothetical protein